MTWQLGAFAILGIGLVTGFAWYERTRPDARIVALVGTLAAFAALGRIAFAAVPNVKPTSDIVLISGYALGGAPGYVVGAVAALSSNLFFGQGPWTPWQMAGWGATGVAGALIARLTGGRIGRVPLAILCFVLGFAFTALQDVGDWMTYSDHSPAELGVYLGKGIGFDVVHACGCFGFAMLFGPAFARTLRRFRGRVDVTWLPAAARTCVPVLFAALALVSATGAGRPAKAVAAAPHRTPIQYLLGAQNRDGGFGMAPGQGSSPMVTAWAALGLASAPNKAGGSIAGAWHRAVLYLAQTVKSEHGAGAIERTVLAANTLGVNLRRFGGRNLITALRGLRGRNGSIGDQANLTAFGVLAMRAAGMRVGERTISWLARQQDSDGGYNFGTRGGQSDVDDTGAVLQALAGSDRIATIRRAVAFLRAQQNRDGGFGAEPGVPSNAQSTAFAVSGLIAAFVQPRDVHRHGSPSPIAYLRSQIQPDGAVDYSRGNPQTPVWVTAQAEIALSGHSL